MNWILNNYSSPAVVSWNNRMTWQPITDAINDLYDEGLLVTVSSGNEGELASNWGTNNAYGALVVGGDSIDMFDYQTDGQWSAANYGSAVNLLAPAGAMYAADTGGTHTVRAGTSLSGPIVAGVAALALEEDPDLTPAELFDILTEGATLNQISAATLNRSPNRLVYSLHLWMEGISGPTVVYEEGNQTFSPDNLIGGSGSNTYQWYYKASGAAGFTSVGTSSSYVRDLQEDDPDFEVKVTVSSAGGSFSRTQSVALCWNHAEIECEANQ